MEKELLFTNALFGACLPSQLYGSRWPIILNSELCSNVGVPGNGSQVLVNILGQAVITQFIPLASHSKT